ncbi:MFS transporter [Roseateles sp. SL47]|uniref:MFS transporter n=1 Tax=Roseateles sp. SL47 TaxID=2995138 RepID=UPI00226FCDAB|nr:MFS transporter [Roseateles sp. SL47]WAC71982.1 MFS transporter [Roseateles sp. SL47]
MSQRPQGYTEFRRGWPIVLASMLGVGLGLSPLPFYTTGVLAPHLHAEFGWGMGQIFFGITITTFVVLFAGPLAGFLAARWGTRPVALGSLLLFSLAFMALAFSNGSLPQYYLTWGAIALLGAGTLPITWTRGVNHWFDERKGLALGLTLMGTGVFGIFAKPMTAWMITHFGWRGAYIGLGLLPLLIAFPVAFALFRNTDDDTHSTATSRPSDGLSFSETLRSWRLWLMGAAFIPISFALGGPIPNMENILRANGFAPEVVIRLTPFIGLSALIGRIAGGWLVDRFWAPAVALIILSLPGLSCLLLAQSQFSFEAALLSIFLIGFAVGVEYDLMAFFVARYFGMKSYTQTYSLLYVCFSIGAGLGPAVFGWSFDRTGNYQAVLTASALGLVLGAASFLALGRYRVPAAVSPARPLAAHSSPNSLTTPAR